MNAPEPRAGQAGRTVAALLSAGLAFALAVAVTAAPWKPGLSDAVRGSMEKSGVKSEVTAVLLNFRGYDTLLEICVLLVAMLGVLALSADGPPPKPKARQDPALSGLARVLAPFMVLTSGYLLQAGAYAPGGAFQAGAVLGAAIVLSKISGIADPDRHRALFLAVSMLGFCLFLAVAALPLFTGDRLLEYPAGYAHHLILAVEGGLTISIALILSLLFAPGTGSRGQRSAPARKGGAE